jgi:hypothetical protein
MHSHEQMKALVEITRFCKMNDNANKELLDHVHRKLMQAMIDVASLEHKNVQLTNSLGGKHHGLIR